MTFLRQILVSRFGKLGLLSDVAIVVTAATRMARKPAGQSSAATSPSAGEMLLVGGSAFRLLRRLWRALRRKRTPVALSE